MKNKGYNQKYCLGEDFFKKYQKILLWLLNAPIVKYWFRWVMRIRSFDCPFNVKIDEIGPNRFTFNRKLVLADYLVFKDGRKVLYDPLNRQHRRLARKCKIEQHLAVQQTTDFRTHNKFTKRLYYAFYPVWYLCHLWDLFWNSLKVPAFNLGFDTLTKYPDAGTGATTVDGWVRRLNTSGETWTDIRTGAGTQAYPTDTQTIYLGIYSDEATDRWEQVPRSIFTLDTSSLGNNATISNATFSLYGTSKYDPSSFLPDINIYSSNPSANNNLQPSDYNTFGTTAFSTTISYSDWSISGYNNFAFNTTGKNTINKTGITKLGARDASHDVANSAPTWASAAASYLYGYYADQSGTTQDPKLVVTYTVPATYYKTLAVTEVSSIVLSRIQTIYKILAVVESSVITLTRGFSKILSVIETSIPHLGVIKVFGQTLSVIENSIITLTTLPKKILSVVVTTISEMSLFKSFYRTLSVVENSVVNLTRGLYHSLEMITVEISTIALLVSRFVELHITETVIPSLNKVASYFRSLSVVENSIAVLSKVSSFFKTLSVTEISVATIGWVRSIILSVISTAIVSLTMIKTFFRKLEVKVFSLVKLIFPTRYWDKFTKQGDAYTDKFTKQNNSYQDKYPNA